jgi:membrane-bound lytic murein transglycosylase C
MIPSTGDSIPVRRRALLRSTLTFGAGAAAGATVGRFAGGFTAPPAGEADVVPQAMAEHDAGMSAALEQAHLELEGEAGRLWGEQMLMPSRTVWVGYDRPMTSRAVLDFEAGELRAEALVTREQDTDQAVTALRATVAEVLRSSEAEMLAHDTLMQRTRGIAAGMGMAMEQPTSAGPQGPMLDGMLPADAALQVRPERLTVMALTGRDGERRAMLAMRLPFAASRHLRLARRYEAEVLAQARRQELAPSLILAVMQIESAFNPMAVSPAPAYGLMQLVPRSGGLDAYCFLHGEPRLLDPPVLFDPATNVKLGAAYLKLLDSRYLAAVQDPTSRLYCVIAAYNTGAGNVARAFTGRTSVRAAAETINRLPPERVLEHLRLRLPFEETRRYLPNVLAARETYRSWDEPTFFG